MSELELKLGKIRDMLAEHRVDALLLRQAANFAWATCGASACVNVAETCGAASLLITRYNRYVITNNIEATRLQEEEHLSDQGWEFRITPWYEEDKAVAELTRGMAVGTDSHYAGAADLQGQVAHLRAALLPEEVERFRALSHDCAEAMDTAIMSICPGLTESQIAGVLARETLQRGVEPIVHLVGTDERIFRYRHPLPTEKRLEHYAMLVLCGRKWGLVCSLTRLLYFGRLPQELREKSRAVAMVDAHFISATRPGRKLSAIFHEAAESYRTQGYADEWQLLHQGGLAGYIPREIVATPDSDETVTVDQVYAWNPSITGVKSEDTFLVSAQENEVLTAIPRWPVYKVDLRGHTLARPLILEVD